MAQTRGAEPRDVGRLSVSIGERIREMRRARALTLRHVAAELEISPSALSQIETGVLAPSISRLHEIVSVLGFTISAVFEDGPLDPSANVTSAAGALTDSLFLQRAEEAPRLEIAGGVEWTQLAPDTEAGVEVLRIRYPPGAGEPEYRRHRGRDTVAVLEGQVRVSVEFRSFDLEAGDSMTFASSQPHRVANPSAACDAVVLWVSLRS